MESGAPVKENQAMEIMLVLASLAMIVMFTEIMLVPALPQIQADFPQDAHWISWVLSIYLLVGAVATPLVGRLGDLYGKKKILIMVMAVYAVALIGCGFSLEISQALFGRNDIFVLLFFRALQGIGMGMFTLGFGIVRDTFPRDKIPMAIGLISAMFSVGVGIGLVGGGYITSVAKWTDAFHIVTPLFVILAVAAYFLIKDPVIVHTGRLDIPGAVSLGIGVFAFLLALTQGEEWGWTSSGVVLLFALSVMFIAAFVIIERRTKDPIVRPALFKNRGILGSSAVALFVGLCMFMVYQTLPYYLMTPIPLGGNFGLMDTFTVGLYMLPSAIIQLFVGPLGGTMSKKRGAARILALGMGVLALGLLSLTFLHSDVWQLTLSLLIFGAGTSLCMVSMINVVVDSCPQSEFGVASGMNTLFRIVGGSIGPVLAAVILAGYRIVPTPFSTEQGYVLTWAAALAFAVAGLIAAVVLRPRASDKCDIRPQDLPPPGH